jgi:hypothetical protein
MAAAASSLKSQAMDLVQTVALFKLTPGHDGVPVPRSNTHLALGHHRQ